MAGTLTVPPLSSRVDADTSAQMVAVLANMLESALVAGALPTPAVAAAPPRTLGRVDGDDARGAEGDRLAPGTHRDGLHSTVHTGASAGAHRVHRAPVPAGRRGGAAGLGRGRHRGHRRRPGPVRAHSHLPRRVQAPGGPGVPGRGGGGVRAGGLPAGPLQRGPVPAAGAGPPHRHARHRQRRRLRPVRHQRPAAAGP
jgi:hypothetical protein